MDEEVIGGGVKAGKKIGEGEVDYKSKSGTAWSHNFLNQKPWHPLSYPNMRRKWIAEQTHANRQRRQEEVSREFAQEQQFFRQTALFNKKDKEKVEMMKAVSFMYVRPPGYNPESAKAAEVADQNKSAIAAASTSDKDPQPDPDPQTKNPKSRPKDIYGRTVPTENEFEVLKNAPKLDTGMAGRSKPFAVEIRNVRCVRCGTFGHQSGDRECPLKDTIMPNDETRLKRDDPLNAILAQTDLSEPLKWELKQKPGISPPRGGFNPDDPNQQILPDQEEIFDEYGGFLSGGGIPIPIPALISNICMEKEKPKKKKKHSSSSKSKHKSDRDCESEEFEKKKGDRSKSRRFKRHRSRESSDDASDEGDRKIRRRSKGREKHRAVSDSNGPSSSSSPYSYSHYESRGERRKKKDLKESPVYEREYEDRKGGRENKSSRKKHKEHAREYEDRKGERENKKHKEHAADSDGSDHNRHHRHHHQRKH